jgi:flagellar L-ring protein precursor FlgH
MMTLVTKSMSFYARILLGLMLALPAGAQTLYSEASFRSLGTDHKAHRVGDVITIQVIENASAAANTDTGTRRRNSLAAGLAHRQQSVAGSEIEVNGDFDGGGRTARAGRLLAQISVSVRDVLPNGDLKVAGEQILLINEEQQRINIEGRVRPQDVSEGNVVLSTRLADARITYVGEGDLAERGRPSWWRRLLDALGL